MVTNISKMLFITIMVFVCLSIFVRASEPDDSFVLGSLKVAAGEWQSGYLSVPEKEGIATVIPVTVINGLKKGKVLALVAGVHGSEYPPILALYRLREMIDLKQLAGTVVVVHIANLPSFQRRMIYYNPFDWKNLNRVFPGQLQGSLSQRIAYVLNEEIIKRCDYLIDLHCGDANEALIPYTYWMISGKEKMDEKSKEMALAFGLRHIIIDTTRSKELAQSKYLGNTAVLQGKPAITTEAGLLGKTDEEFIAQNVKGILSVMKLFRMIEGKAEFVSDPVWVDKYEVIYSNHDGLFYPQIKMGSAVVQGQKVGYVTDYLGKVVEELVAPFSGVILYIINTPPANKGEPLFEVGQIKASKRSR